MKDGLGNKTSLSLLELLALLLEAGILEEPETTTKNVDQEE